MATANAIWQRLQNLAPATFLLSSLPKILLHPVSHSKGRFMRKRLTLRRYGHEDEMVAEAGIPRLCTGSPQLWLRWVLHD